MKRTEVVKLIAETLGQLPAPARSVAEQVLSRLEGPLAIDYDPEEVPLPERLWVTPNGAYIREEGDAVMRPFLAVISSLGCWDQCFAPDAVCAAVAKEAVRRWNAWKNLETLEGTLRITGRWQIASMLRQILDGKEGE